VEDAAHPRQCWQEYGGDLAATKIAGRDVTLIIHYIDVAEQCSPFMEDAPGQIMAVVKRSATER
jgi:hypothetical protein